jgi:hypothetical protein
MDEVVYVVLYNNPTGAGALLKGVWKHYTHAEAFVQRQSYPDEYRIEMKQVQYA